MSTVLDALQPLLDQQTAAMLAGDLPGFMATIDPESPFYDLMRAYWSFYVTEVRVTAVRSEVRSIEVNEKGLERVWLRQVIDYESFEPQVMTAYVDLVQKPDGRWLCHLVNRMLPSFDDGVPFAAPLLPLPGPSAPEPPRRIGAEEGGPETYLHTVLRRYKFLRTRPYLGSALVVANMMTQTAGRVLAVTYHPDQTEWLRRLAVFWRHRAQHLHETSRPHPWPTALHGMLRGPKQGADEMLAFGTPERPIIGLCDALQALMAAVLRLGGMPPERVWEVSLMSAGTTHAVTLVDADAGPLMVSNNYILAARGIPYQNNQVIYVLNDRSYWTTHGLSNLSPAELARVVALHRAVSPSFDLPRRVSLETYQPTAPAGPVLSVAYRPGEAPADLAARVRQAVAALAEQNAGLVYTHAWYAYQAVHVRWPETYFRASMQAPLAQDLARRLDTIPALLAWIAGEIGPRSIFTEPGRIMTAEQVLVHRTGGAWDRALLAAALAVLMGHRACCVLGRDTGYLAYYAGARWQYVDMQSFAGVEALPADVLMAFGAEEAYQPGAGRTAPIC